MTKLSTPTGLHAMILRQILLDRRSVPSNVRLVLEYWHSFIAEAIENEFTAANIQILTEFGIPSSAIRKILDRYGHHLKGLTEDQVVAAIIRNRELINRCLSVYEIEALEMCL